MSLDAVFERMADDLGIKKGKTEESLSWKCRIAYSVSIKRGLDALWEKEDDVEQNGTVSLLHITRTIKQVFRAFHVLCPEMAAVMQDFMQLHISDGESPEKLLIELLQKGGCFYHSPYRAAPAIFAGAHLAGTMFLRGLPLEEVQCMSGAGMYAEAPIGGCPENVATLFGLRKILSGTDMDRLENSLPKQHREYMDSWEFLDLSRKNGKYWKDKPDKGVTSLARRVHKVEKVYTLYRYDGSRFLCRALPECWHSGTRYLALAVALLSRRGILPAITMKDDGPVVSLKVGYLLPPAEETFFRLYSWPDIVRKRNPYFSRVMTRSVFEAFQILMTHLGYTFLEESHG